LKYNPSIERHWRSHYTPIFGDHVTFFIANRPQYYFERHQTNLYHTTQGITMKWSEMG